MALPHSPYPGPSYESEGPGFHHSSSTYSLHELCYLTSLCLSLPICKTGMNTLLCKVVGNSLKVLSTGAAMHEVLDKC